MRNRRRKSPRLPGFDYRQAGAYFITVCVKNRHFLFGEVKRNEMILNEAGRMVEQWWGKLNTKFAQVETDYFTVMPNHIHGIISIVDTNQRVRTKEDFNWASQEGAHTGAPLQEVIQWFKSMTTNDYIRGVRQSGWIPFSKKLWQRSFYEHVIRDEASLNRVREYIVNNPVRWELDRENPRRTGDDEFDQWMESFKTRPNIQRTRP